MNAQEIGPWVSLAKDCLIAAAAVTAAVVGILGLRTWWRALRGTEAFRLARRIRHAALMVQNAFFFSRRRGIGAHETKARPGEPDDAASPPEVRALRRRMSVLYKELSRLERAVVWAKVLWDDDLRSLMDPIRGVIAEHDYNFFEFCEASRPGQRLYDREEIRDARALFLGSINGDDEMAKKITSAVDALCGRMKGHL